MMGIYMINTHKILSWLIVFLLISITIISLNLTADEIPNSPAPIGNQSRQIQNDTWPMFRGDATRTGNTTATGPDYYYELWNVNTGVYWGSPVVMYDQIYLCVNGGTRCYNMTGGLIWTYNTGSLYSTPLVHDGRVYVAASNGDLLCLDANATGSGTTSRYWLYSPSGVNFGASSPVTDGKKIYYPTQHASGLHAVWLSNGSKAWNAPLGGSTSTEASPAYWNGRVYCGGGYSYNGGSDTLFCFNASDGGELWNYSTGSDVVSTPAVEYGRVYFGSMDEKVYCVDAVGSNGSTTKYWDYDTNAGTQGVYSSPAVAYGRVYIGATNSHLYCLDAFGSSGSTTVIWDQTILPSGNWGVVSSAAVTKDYVFVGNSNNAIHCRNRTTGNEVWSKTLTPTSTYGIGSPAVYKDTLIVSSDNFYLYALGVDKVPPKIETTSPIDDEIDVDMYQNISIQFNEKIDISTLTTTNLVLKDSSDDTVSGTIEINTGVNTVYFNPSSPMEKEESYNFTVTTDIMDKRGNHLDGNGNGIAQGAGIDEYKFSFTTIPYYPPIINNFQIPKLTEDVPYYVNLSTLINDQDTPDNELVLTEDSPYATLKGMELHLLYPEGVTSDVINLTVSDNKFTVFRIINIQVKPVNDPPIVTKVPELSLTEDIQYSLDMADHIYDIDTPLSAISLFNTNNSKYIDIDRLLINFTYPNGITSDKVNITIVEDEYLIYTEISVKIKPVNDPPKISGIPVINVNEDESSNFTLVDYIYDLDTPKEDLEITVDSDYVNVLGQTLFIKYPEGIFTDALNVEVYDGQYYDNVTVKVIISPVNDPPEVLKIVSPSDGDTFDHDEPIEFKAQVFDSDLPYGDTLYFYWEDSESGYFAYDQNASDITLKPGTHKITFTVEDEAGLDDSKEITITIKAPDIVDTDNDKIPDDQDEDDDGDGIPDTWELKYPNYLDPKDSSDASLDSDNDTFSNLDEYLGIDGKPGGGDSSDPTSKSSIPKKEDETDKKDKESSSNFGLIIGVVLIVVIILILLAIFFMMKKKGKKGEEETTPAPQPTMQQVPPQEQVQPPMQMPMQMPMPVEVTPQAPGQQQPYQELVQPYQQYPEQSQYQQDMYQTQDTGQMYQQYPEQPQEYTQMQDYGYGPEQFAEAPEQPTQFPEQPVTETPLLPETQTQQPSIEDQGENIDTSTYPEQQPQKSEQDQDQDLLQNASIFTLPTEGTDQEGQEKKNQELQNDENQ